MNPPNKVYEKRKEKGSSSKSKVSVEPTQKKARIQTFDSTQPIIDQPETTLPSTPHITNDPPTNPTTDKPSAHPQPILDIQSEPQSDTATETIMQVVGQLNEGDEDINEEERKEVREEQETEGEEGNEPYDDFRFSNR